MSVTVGRAKVVDFAEPYYYDSGAVAVPNDSTVQSLSELNDGKTFCVGTATTYEQWLNGTLEIVDPNIVPAPTDPAGHRRCRPTTSASRPSRPGARTTPSSPTATAWPTRSPRAPPIRVLDGPPIFTVSVAFALDKSGPNTERCSTLLNEIVTEMHADGTLKGFSEKWLEKDVTTKPS